MNYKKEIVNHINHTVVFWRSKAIYTTVGEKGTSEMDGGIDNNTPAWCQDCKKELEGNPSKLYIEITENLHNE